MILTSFSDRARILEALDAGAVGYLLKDATPAELESGIRAAARGESPLHPRAARALLSAAVRPDPAAGLSAREREVLALVVEGLPNKLIARRLEHQREDRQGPPHQRLPGASAWTTARRRRCGRCAHGIGPAEGS